MPRAFLHWAICFLLVTVPDAHDEMMINLPGLSAGPFVAGHERISAVLIPYLANRCAKAGGRLATISKAKRASRDVRLEGSLIVKGLLNGDQ